MLIFIMLQDSYQQQKTNGPNKKLLVLSINYTE